MKLNVPVEVTNLMSFVLVDFWLKMRSRVKHRVLKGSLSSKPYRTIFKLHEIAPTVELVLVREISWHQFPINLN